MFFFFFYFDFPQSEIGPQGLMFALRSCSVQFKMNPKNTEKAEQFCNNSLNFFFGGSSYKAQLAAHNIAVLYKKIAFMIIFHLLTHFITI